jgi:hypothetical protein
MQLVNSYALVQTALHSAKKWGSSACLKFNPIPNSEHNDLRPRNPMD